MAEAKKEAQEPFLSPEGRLIHHSLFTKDQFNDSASPSYKIELAIPADSPGLDGFYNKLYEFADATWGSNYSEEDLVLPIKDGNAMAAKRERNGKSGDAYKDMLVIRPNTQFNGKGENAPGGVQVFNDEGIEIEVINRGIIYPGCMGYVGLTIGSYESENQQTGTSFPALTLYMTAFMKSNEGDKLVAQRDNSKLFAPVGRKRTASETGGAAPAGLTTGVAPARRRRAAPAS